MALYNNSLYPLFGVLGLREQRGERWAELVDRVSKLPPSDPQVIAFTLTTRRLRKYNNLEHSVCRDPFCAVCAAHVVAVFDGGEQELLDIYYRNLDEVRATLRGMRVREDVAVAVVQTSAVA